MPNQPLTHTQIQMRRAGFTIKEIAQQTGANERTLGEKLRRAGIKPDVPIVAKPRTSEKLYQIIDHLYWTEKLTMYEIAERLGCAYGNVAWHMRMAGIPRRNKTEAAAVYRERKARLGTG